MAKRPTHLYSPCWISASKHSTTHRRSSLVPWSLNTEQQIMDTITFHLTLVRHGQAESNLKEGVTHGCTESPLTEMGRSQAQQVGARLRDEKFDLVYSSDLSRAYDTCLAITGDPEV